MMKKFLVSVLICVGIIGAANAMEQSLDLSCILETCSDENQIACWLDGKSFSSLTQVCTLFQSICNRIPVKYLAIDFSDAADHGNKNLIGRCIAQMFQPGMGQETHWKDGGNDTVKIFKRLFGKGLQSFLGDCLFYCVSHADTIVRCFWYWNSPELFEDKPQAAHCTSFNIEECDDAVNVATKECLKCFCSSIDDPYFFDEVGRGRWVYNVSMLYARSEGEDCFKLSGPLHPVEIFIKKFGMLMLLIVAAQKNSTAVVCSILNNSTAPDSWIKDIARDRRRYFLPIYSCEHKYEDVSQVLARALKLRLMQSNES